MSIWCSQPSIGHDQWTDDPPVGDVRSYAEGWSNHYPTTDGAVEQPANIDLAHTPVWCVPGHHDDDDERVGPWLRLGVYTTDHDGYTVGNPKSATVVMDEAAVTALRDQLTEWLDHPKAQPEG